jgi:GntR family transcriptional regulator, transcriptional repressor for pyruvate dehydrogenase complex
VTGTTSTTSARIHARLRSEILAGAHAPGDALPSERRLSEELGAGRHAVREALKRLQQSGLVRISQGGATRVRDWRRHGGLDLLIELGASGDVPHGLGLERAVMEMRASVGADAARRCAARANAVVRAELEARAAMLAAEDDLGVRNTIYEAFWDLVIEGADNLAYRLALNTLVAGQRLLAFEPALVGAELADARAVRALAAAIAGGDEDAAYTRARELLERSEDA